MYVRRIISIGLLALMILSGLVVLDLVPVENAEAAVINPTWNPNGYYETNDDWTVVGASQKTWTDLTIVCNGDVIVTAGNILTLINTELIMNCTSDGQYNITVQTGAGMEIKDHDSDPQTTTDASVITSSSTSYEYGFVVNPGATFDMRYSELSECGWDFNISLTEHMSGLQIMNSDANIVNNTISDCYIGIVLYNAQGTNIEGNIFTNNYDSAIWGTAVNTGITVYDNDISNSWRGMAFNQTAYSSITYNYIHNMVSYGIEVRLCDNLTIDHNTISDVYSLTYLCYGIYVQELLDSDVTYNEVDLVYDIGIWIAALCNRVTVSNNVVTDCYGTDSYAMYVSATNLVTVENNHIFDNPYIGLIIATSSNATLSLNTIENINGFGLYVVQNIGSVDVLENTIFNCSFSLMFQEQDGFYAYGNEVSGGGDTGWYANEGGINVWDSTNGLLKENYVHDNYILSPVSRFPITGYWFYMSDDVIIESETIEDNQVNLAAYGSLESTRSTIVDVRNCTFIQSIAFTDYDINITADYNPTLEKTFPSYVNMVNTSWTDTSVDWADTEPNKESEIRNQWWLNVRLKYAGNPVPDASVWANDTFGNKEDEGTTNAQGWAEWLICTEWMEKETNDNRTTYTPHNIKAVDENNGREGSAQETMDKSRWITINLNAWPEVIDLGPIGSSVLRESELTITANGDDEDSDDTEDEFDAYFEYRYHDGPPEWVNHTSPGNYFVSGSLKYVGVEPSGHHEIKFKPRYDAALGNYDFRVRFVDDKGGSSRWFEVVNMTDVQNNQPWVEKLYNETDTPPYINRGDTAWIIADAQDVENQDDDNFTSSPAAEFQYKIPGGSWGSHTDYWEMGAVLHPYNHDWTRRFKPQASIDTPLGKYGFQVRFKDNDGLKSEWKTLDTWLEVRNNIPNPINLEASYSEVYRGQEIWLYANATDVEEKEDDLTVQFWYDAPGGGLQDWENTWLSGKAYVGNSPGGYWTIRFQPTEAENRLGVYKFKVRFTDFDGDYKEIVIPGLVEVKNNLPTVDSVEILDSDADVRAGGGTPIYIQVNADDFEDGENELKVYATADDIQYRYYGKQGTSPGNWESSDYFGASSFETAGSYIKVPFQPDSDADVGYYDIRVRVTDKDTGQSDYVILADGVKDEMIQVHEPKSVVVNVEPIEEEVYRTDTVYIKVEVSDTLNKWNELTVYVQHSVGGGQWKETYIGEPEESGDGDWWEVPFTPDEDAVLGFYEFRAQVKNTDDILGDWVSPSGDKTRVNVKNNLPTTYNLRIEGSNNKVERGSSIYVYVDGSDIEDTEDQLSLNIEYSPDGSTWDDIYLEDYRPPSGSTPSWRITFSPPPSDGFDTGFYDFRAKFSDTNGGSQEDPITASSLVQVTNAKPEVEDFQVPKSVFRTKSTFIGANASDVETDENELIPNFEYQGPSGGWVGYGDSGSYFQDEAQYINGYWQIEFKPPANAKDGEYSFQVTFSDGEDDSQTETRSGSMRVKNNPPEIKDLVSPTEGKQDSDKITFEADVEDEEDGSSVTYNWDFGDGDSSSDAVPEHTYGEPGTYKVTLTVTDSNDGEAEYSFYIEIPGGGDGGGVAGMDMMLLIGLLIPLIVVILVLILLLTRAKKKPEEAPPPIAPTAAPAPPGAPPAEVPTAAPAAMAAPPPPAPAAVPVGAPPPPAAPAGQKIKCPKCGTAFNVESTERPITIQCPSCGAKGKLN